MATIRIVTIDGPSGSGKGTISRLLAEALGWHYLDSGALYRLLALTAARQGLQTAAAAQLSALAHHLDIQFQGDTIILAGVAVSTELRSEAIGNLASQLAAVPSVRAALLNRQRAFAQPPGLVADGRDMGTVVFPEAQVKIFLTASAEERAQRRYKQLKQQGLDASLPTLTADLAARDIRDRERSVAPLQAAAAALIVESTGHSIAAVLERVREQVLLTFPELQVKPVTQLLGVSQP